MRISRLSPVLLATVALAACSEAASTPADGLKISVAPLTLPSLSKVCYDIKVTNAADKAGDTVWSKGSPGLNGGTPDADAICSTEYGNNGGGAITYIGPCDADGPDGERMNSVTIWFDGIYDSSGVYIDPAGPQGWQNPCLDGCTLNRLCKENADTLVEFNFTIMRQANQGFFDIAVNFDDIFCSAKVDCQYGPDDEIELLYNPNTSKRDQTVVLGFACTAGSGSAKTVLLRDPIVVTCGNQSTIIDPALGPGNVYGPIIADPNPLDAIWQYATYFGNESLACDGGPGSCNKLYWNVAIGFDPSTPDCTVTTTATAIDANTNTTLSTPSDSTYPLIDVDVRLTGLTGGLACDRHALNVTDSGVSTTYTTVTQPKSFAHSFAGDPPTGPPPTANCGTLGPCPSGFVCTPQTTCENPSTGEIAIRTATFVMGCSWEHAADNDCDGTTDTNPEHIVTISTFAMDRYPVTAAAYANCVNAGNCQPPDFSGNSDYSTYGTYGMAGKEAHPMNFVTYPEAANYCASEGQRLCTEAEFELSARGGCETVGTPCSENMRRFPWGFTWPSCDTNLSSGWGCAAATTQVGAYSPAGDSVYGAGDLVGSLSQWVSDYYDGGYSASDVTDPQGPESGYNGWRVVRNNATYRSYFPPETRAWFVGFRCCRSLPPD